ncbi:MAG: plasmid replication initiator protein [Propionibacteriales bacterium]|nr:plasmid replication initiator protein [Propionibacteriales bacterium]
MTVSTVTFNPELDSEDSPGSEAFAELDFTDRCINPIRLHGQIDTVDMRTGQVLATHHTDRDGAVYVACKDRREAVCPSCATLYRHDTRQLLRSGLAGGKGVPDTVQQHPAVLLTVTAPSFGIVHSRRTAKSGRVIRCRARSQARRIDRCKHGVLLRCEHVHGKDDRRLGQPFCLDCYDHDAQVVWNAHAAELWRRTSMTIRRRLESLADNHEVSVRASYAKVAEDQARGVVHFHVLIRLDGIDPDDPQAIVPPPPCVDVHALKDACLEAAASTAFSTVAHPDSPEGLGWPIRWGNARVDIIRDGIREVTEDECRRIVGYLAKYATKSTGASGAVLRRILPAFAFVKRDDGLRRSPWRYGNIEDYDDPESHRDRLIQACWRIGRARHHSYRALRRWAHKLGFRGHFSTRSRCYGTTLGALRRARQTYSRAASLEILTGVDLDDIAVVSCLHYADTGWRTTDAAALANSAAARAREYSDTATEELSAA